MKKSLLVLLIALFLTGCASGYGKYGFFNSGGYQEKSLSSDSVLVTFTGSSYTSIEKTYAYAMRRAAEITLKHGYSYFLVLSNRSYFKKETTETSTVTLTAAWPTSEIKIQFSSHKTAKTYDAKKVLAELVK